MYLKLIEFAEDYASFFIKAEKYRKALIKENITISDGGKSVELWQGILKTK